METVWFCLVAIMLAVYVLLDSFDLGAGAIHLLAAKTDEERRASDRCGTATKSGCWPRVARCILPSRRFIRAALADSTCR